MSQNAPLWLNGLVANAFLTKNNNNKKHYRDDTSTGEQNLRYIPPFSCLVPAMRGKQPSGSALKAL